MDDDDDDEEEEVVAILITIKQWWVTRIAPLLLVDLKGILGTTTVMLPEEEGPDEFGRRSLLPIVVPARRKERVLGSNIIVERRSRTRMSKNRLGLFMIQRGGQSLDRQYRYEMWWWG